MPEGVQELKKERHADDFDADLMEEIEAEAKITLCAILGNEVGEVEYTFYLEDPKNLKEPISFSISVKPNGTTDFLHLKFTEDAFLLQKDYQEFLNRIKLEKK